MAPPYEALEHLAELQGLRSREAAAEGRLAIEVLTNTN